MLVSAQGKCMANPRSICSSVQEAASNCHPAAGMHADCPGVSACRELQTSDGNTLTLASLAGDNLALHTASNYLQFYS